MLQNLEIIIGTYEEFLLGYRIQSETNHKKDNIKYSFVQTFATHNHTASVRCIDSHGKYLVSGGADDRIFIIDMKTRKENNILTHHGGTINQLQFTPDGSHLFTAGSDGTLAAVRTGSWQIDNLWKSPHTGKSVTNISLHPSGKLALTIGGDSTLRTWNLISGRQIFTVNLKNIKPLQNHYDCLEWNPNGIYFSLAGLKIVQIWNTEIGGVFKTIQCEDRPSAICWLDMDNILIGLKNGKIIFVNVLNENDKENKIVQVTDARIKSLSYIDGYLIMITSIGKLILYEIEMGKKLLKEQATLSIDCRPTCIKIIDVSEYEQIKKVENEPEVNETTSELTGNVNKHKKNSRIVTKGKVTVEIDDDDDDYEEETNNKYVKSNKSPLTKKSTIKGKQLFKKSNEKQKIQNDNENKLKKINKSFDAASAIVKKNKTELHQIKLKRRTIGNSKFIEDAIDPKRMNTTVQLKKSRKTLQ